MRLAFALTLASRGYSRISPRIFFERLVAPYSWEWPSYRENSSTRTTEKFGSSSYFYFLCIGPKLKTNPDCWKHCQIHACPNGDKITTIHLTWHVNWMSKIRSHFAACCLSVHLWNRKKNQLITDTKWLPEKKDKTCSLVLNWREF